MKRVYKRMVIAGGILFGGAASTLSVFAHPALALMGIGLIATGYHTKQHLKKEK